MIQPRLHIVPVTRDDAQTFLRLHHRHLPRAPRVAIFRVGVVVGSCILVGVATVGTPRARRLQDDRTLEIYRCCTDGTPNAPSCLYRACWRVARELGWSRLITYTLDEEPGTSLEAAGFRVVAETKGGRWSRAGRERKDDGPLCRKLRWEAA